jgi:hypothetical protein
MVDPILADWFRSLPEEEPVAGLLPAKLENLCPFDWLSQSFPL